MQRIALLCDLTTFAILRLLFRESNIALSESVIRDVAVNVIVMQILHVCLIGKARIRRHDSAVCVDVV